MMKLEDYFVHLNVQSTKPGHGCFVGITATNIPEIARSPFRGRIFNYSEGLLDLNNSVEAKNKVLQDMRQFFFKNPQIKLILSINGNGI